jgi:hypothetical protein
MFIQLAATHERANSTTFGTRAPREQRQRQEPLFCQRTYARLARVMSFVEKEFFAARRFVSPARWRGLGAKGTGRPAPGEGGWSVPFALLLDGAGPPIRSQVAQQRRGATDSGEHRQATGAVAQDSRPRNPNWRPPTHATNRRMAMAVRWRPEPGAQRRQIGRAVLMGLFWVWGAFGLIGNLLSLNSEIGVAALSSQLLWIGGMLLFGLGALLLRPTPSK